MQGVNIHREAVRIQVRHFCCHIYMQVLYREWRFAVIHHAIPYFKAHAQVGHYTVLGYVFTAERQLYDTYTADVRIIKQLLVVCG